jgi:hypothetical protein
MPGLLRADKPGPQWSGLFDCGTISADPARTTLVLLTHRADLAGIVRSFKSFAPTLF